jgi:hypothetical protein
MSTNFPIVVHVVFSDMAENVLLFSGSELSAPYTEEDDSVESLVHNMVAQVYPSQSVIYQYITTQFCAQENGVLRVWFVATPLTHTGNKRGQWALIDSIDLHHYPQKVLDVLKKYHAFAVVK